MRPLRLPIVAAAAVVAALAGAAGAPAATFVVTSQDDADDGTCDAPHCSLREAIHAANVSGTADEIIFVDDDPITPATELPAITDTVFITAFNTGRCNTDSAPLRLKGRGAGFSGLVFAPGSDGSRVCLVNVGGFRTGIELASDENLIKLSTIGTNADGTSDDPNTVDGIQVTGDRNLIGGLAGSNRNVISGNGQSGVSVIEGAGNQIMGNLIGTDAQARAELPNEIGVSVSADATDTAIGSDTPGFGNVISGNDTFGVDAGAGRIVGNHIGVDRVGTFPIENRVAGVHAFGPVQIGGRTEAERNVISGNNVDVLVDGPATVEGNWIGPAADGNELERDFPLLGRETGVRLRAGAAGATIGGANPAAGNVIGGQQLGVEATGPTGGFAVEGNLIGLAPDGTTEIATAGGIQLGAETDDATIVGNTAIGAGRFGILVAGEGTHVEGNTVGLDGDGAAHGELGPLDERDTRVGVIVDDTAERTTLTANTISGLPTGIELRRNSGPTTVATTFVGTDAEGTVARPNLVGVAIGPRSQARIGGGNVISGNAEAGVYSESRTVDAIIEGNFIGVAADGATPLGNRSGVILTEDKIVGPAVGDGFVVGGNRIAHNFDDGVEVTDVSAATRIEANEIFANGDGSGSDLGIDFLGDGVSPNGRHAPDALPPFPVITNIDPVAVGTSVQGTIDNPAGHVVRIDLFAGPACDDSGHGEGQSPLGSLTLTAPGGPAAFSARVAAAPSGQPVITATATDLTSNRTSEFSRCALPSTTSPPVTDLPPGDPPPGTGPGGGTPPGPVVGDPGPPVGLPPVEVPPRLRCKVPKLVGLTLPKAKKRLRGSGCTVGAVKRPRSRRPKGAKLVVKRSSQKAGTIRRKGAAVRLTLKYAPRREETRRGAKRDSPDR